MNIVPVKPLASQTLGIILDGQNTTLRIYQKFYGLYIDVLVNDVLVIGGVVGRNRNRIVRSIYLGYDGDLSFIDTQGQSDPDYTGLGDQFLLIYLSPDEFGQLGVS